MKGNPVIWFEIYVEKMARDKPPLLNVSAR